MRLPDKHRGILEEFKEAFANTPLPEEDRCGKTTLLLIDKEFVTLSTNDLLRYLRKKDDPALTTAIKVLETLRASCQRKQNAVIIGKPTDQGFVFSKMLWVYVNSKGGVS